MIKLKRVFFIIILTFFIIQSDTCVLGQSSDDVILDEYGFDEIQEFIDKDEELEDIDFKQIINDFMTGDAEGGMDKIFDYIKDILFNEVLKNSEILKKILIIAVIAAVFTNFTRILKNSQVSDTGFTICYMMIMSFLITSFSILSALAYSTIGRMADFMKALVPLYMDSIGVSEGQAFAASYYQMTLAVITIIDMFCLKILIPIVDIYVVLVIINNLYSEDYFSKACELIKNIISFGVKGMLTVVMGMNVVRQMFSPIASNIGNMTARNVLGLVSGMGGSSGNITELEYGTSNILKNAIGGAGVIVLAIIVLIPIIKTIIFVFSYQLTNALIQPITDDRIVNCMEGISNAAILMLRIIMQ